MMPPRIPPAPRVVQLKNSVDMQLDNAFHDQQWSIAANLARQRHKSTKDEYYKVRSVLRFVSYVSHLLLCVHHVCVEHIHSMPLK